METIMISKELLEKMIGYVEECETVIDGEWGSCREIEELIRDEMMPEIYYELKKWL